MIHRYWRGVAFPEFDAAYVEHLRVHTAPRLRTIPGFRGMSVLSRGGTDGVEFLVITRWDTVQAIMAFAGDDAESAVVPGEVQQMMRDFDLRARHYEEQLSTTL